MCIIYVLYVLPLKMEKPSESCGVKERCKALRCNSYLYMFVHIFFHGKWMSHLRTVVLTTHSMEEAGALSSRMAIQVMGQLRCLGTPMHIKHKYGTGCLANLAIQWQPAKT